LLLRSKLSVSFRAPLHHRVAGNTDAHAALPLSTSVMDPLRVVLIEPSDDLVRFCVGYALLKSVIFIVFE
jgi:hypothetical protein